MTINSTARCLFKERKIYLQKTQIQILIVALVIIAKLETIPWTGEWVKKIWYMHTMKWNSKEKARNMKKAWNMPQCDELLRQAKSGISKTF